MKEKVWIFLVVAMLAIPLIAPQVKAGYGADNPLQPLPEYNPKKSNLAVSLDFFPVPTSLGFYEFKDENYFRTRRFKFNATVPNATKASYLYLFTSLYDNDNERWYVKLNNEVLVFGEHSSSAGANPKGDGIDNSGEFAEDVPIPVFKQAVRLDVTNKLENGENELSIDGVSFEPGSSKTKPGYSLYGIAVLNLYQTNKMHEIWAYEGVEYFKRKSVLDPAEYVINFEGATYPLPSKASLYVLYLNGNLTTDVLSFNNNSLEDDEAGFYAGTNFITLMKFDVGSYLKKKDYLTFSTPIGEGNAIYPSIVILDVEIEDKTPPTINLSSPKNNSIFLINESINVSYTVDEEISETYVKIGTQIKLPEKVGAVYYATINLSSSGIGNGTKEIVIVAKDLAGNEAKKSLTINITTPEIPEEVKTLDLGIENLTIEGGYQVGEGYQVTKGSDLHLSVLGINNGGENIVGEILVYLDNALIGSQNVTLDAYGHRRVDFVVNGTKLQKGTSEIKAEIRHTSRNFRDNNTANNEKKLNIVIEEEPGISLPPLEKPQLKLKELDLRISSLTIEEGYEVKEGEDLHLYVFGENRGGDNAEVEVSVYVDVDDSPLEVQKTTLDAYGHRRVEFVIKGIKLKKGIREIKAKIRHIGEGFIDTNSANNEKKITIVVEEKKTTFSKIAGIGKWVIAILGGVIILKLIIDFISERTREDYLK